MTVTFVVKTNVMGGLDMKILYLNEIFANDVCKVST